MKKKVLLSTGLKLFNGEGGIQKGIELRTKELCNQFDFDLLLFDPNDKEILRKQFPYIREFYFIYRRNISAGSLIKIRKKLCSFFQHHKYDAVHSHDVSTGGVVLSSAKENGIPVRIISSHNSKIIDSKHSMAYKIKDYLVTKYTIANANRLIGVSQLACDDLFGKRRDTQVLHNGINLEVFDAAKYPKDYGKKDIDFVHVGRFTEQKNHKFLIETFSHIHNRIPNTRLTLIGRGALEENVRIQISALNLNECVTILPHDTYIPAAMSKAEYMIFPSLFEGLSNVVLEAIAMNVMCFGSDCLTREVEQLGLWKALPLSIGSKAWAEYISDFIEQHKEKRFEANKEELAKFDVRETVKKYADLYNGIV